MTLSQKQHMFSRLLPRLLDKAHELGFEVSGGEWERSQAAANAMAALGKGIKNSLHRLRLAVDLHLFADHDSDGELEYLTDTEDHRPLGEWWEKQSGQGFECCWGGRFGDGNHYSIAHGGIK